MFHTYHLLAPLVGQAGVGDVDRILVQRLALGLSSSDCRCISGGGISRESALRWTKTCVGRVLLAKGHWLAGLLGQSGSVEQ